MKWDDFKILTLSEIIGFLFIIVMTPIVLVLLSMLV